MTFNETRALDNLATLIKRGKGARSPEYIDFSSWRLQLTLLRQEMEKPLGPPPDASYRINRVLNALDKLAIEFGSTFLELGTEQEEARSLNKEYGSGETKEHKDRVDFGIISIRGDEYSAILDRLPEALPVQGSQDTSYRVSRVNDVNGHQLIVAVTRCMEQGSVEAQHVATRLALDLSPKWVFVVGIAGGIPDSDFSLGDVVVASRVYDLTLEAADPGGKREFSIKGGNLHSLARQVVQDIPGMSSLELRNWHCLVQMTRPSVDLANLDPYLEGDEDWKNHVKQSLTRHFATPRVPVVVPGSIASSDRRIKDTAITASWKKVARHFVAVEMELAGVCRALEEIPVLGIRGISDIVGFRREDIWTTYACQTAASFAVSLLSSGLLPLKRNSGDSHTD